MGRSVDAVRLVNFEKASVCGQAQKTKEQIVGIWEAGHGGSL